MSLKLKPFLTAALLVAAGVGPARASKRPPKGVWPLFPNIVDDAAVIPLFEPGNGDDVSLARIDEIDWPAAWTLPSGTYASVSAIEGEAIKTADEAMDENDYSAFDWGNPGKNHGTVNRWDD